MLDQKGFSPIFIVLGIVVVLGMVGGAYYLGAQRNQSDLQSQQVVTDHTLVAVKQSPIGNSESNKDSTINLQSYTHPTAKYSFKYPSNWKLEYRQPTDIEHPLDLTIKSLDYSLKTGENIGEDKGVALFIYRSKTDEISIEKKFESELVKQIARDITSTTVDGQKAIQYDYSAESTQSTDTIFIKNGMYYLVKLGYADMKAKNENFSVYSSLLKSFKAY